MLEGSAAEAVACKPDLAVERKAQSLFGHIGFPMFGLPWSIFYHSWGYLGHLVAILELCWPILGLCWAILGSCLGSS